eukprot:1619662-Pyramimonas_sp.AAC.1
MLTPPMCAQMGRLLAAAAPQLRCIQTPHLPHPPRTPPFILYSRCWQREHRATLVLGTGGTPTRYDGFSACEWTEEAK